MNIQSPISLFSCCPGQLYKFARFGNRGLTGDRKDIEVFLGALKDLFCGTSHLDLPNS